MRKRLLILVALVSIGLTTSCSTIGGTLLGAGIGAIAGDAELGAAVGFTAGAVDDVFGYRRRY